MLELEETSMTDPLPIRLPMGMTYPTVNAYLFRHPEPVLVDCGLNRPDSERALRRALKRHGLAFSNLRKVVITHPHVDHVGLAGVLGQSGTEIWLSGLGWEWMSDLKANRSALTRFLVDLMARHGFDAGARERLAGYYDGLDPLYAPLSPDRVRVFRPGDTLEFGGRAWRVVYAPGHSNRQVCFFDEQGGTLLSADMLLPKTPSPVVERSLQDGSRREKGLPQMLESYAAFRDLPVTQVYPGHGEPFGDHRALIDRQLRRIERRKNECLALVRGGCETLPALLEKMYAYMPAATRLGGLAMLLGYLDLLEAEGEVQSVEAGGLRKYLPAAL